MSTESYIPLSYAKLAPFFVLVNFQAVYKFKLLCEVLLKYQDVFLKKNMTNLAGTMDRPTHKATVLLKLLCLLSWLRYLAGFFFNNGLLKNVFIFPSFSVELVLVLFLVLFQIFNSAASFLPNAVILCDVVTCLTRKEFMMKLRFMCVKIECPTYKTNYKKFTCQLYIKTYQQGVRGYIQGGKHKKKT